MYCLGKIECFIEEYYSPYVLICGDFNANVLSDSTFRRELSTFSDNINLKISEQVFNPEGIYTFYSEADNSVSWVDHLVTENNGHDMI